MIEKINVRTSWRDSQKIDKPIVQVNMRNPQEIDLEILGHFLDAFGEEEAGRLVASTWRGELEVAIAQCMLLVKLRWSRGEWVEYPVRPCRAIVGALRVNFRWRERRRRKEASERSGL